MGERRRGEVYSFGRVRFRRLATGKRRLDNNVANTNVHIQLSAGAVAGRAARRVDGVAGAGEILPCPLFCSFSLSAAFVCRSSEANPLLSWWSDLDLIPLKHPGRAVCRRRWRARRCRGRQQQGKTAALDSFPGAAA